MLKNVSQNSRENTCARIAILIKLQRLATFLKKRLWYRCFPVRFAKFLRTPFFHSTLLVGASGPVSTSTSQFKLSFFFTCKITKLHCQKHYDRNYQVCFGKVGNLKSAIYRSSSPELFFGKGVLKICSKVTAEQPCRSVISIKMKATFLKSHGCSPVNLLHIFRTHFYKNTYEGLLLNLLFLFMFEITHNYNFIIHGQYMRNMWNRYEMYFVKNL